MSVDDTSSSRIAVEAPDGANWSAGAWTPDGSGLVIGHYISATDSRLHLLDLESGELRSLTGGADVPASWTGIDPEFTPDGDALFVVTDALDGVRRLGRLDMESGDFEPLTADIDWDVEVFAIETARSHAAFVAASGLDERQRSPTELVTRRIVDRIYASRIGKSTPCDRPLRGQQVW
jgi:hypothetical protein